MGWLVHGNPFFDFYLSQQHRPNFEQVDGCAQLELLGLVHLTPGGGLTILIDFNTFNFFCVFNLVSIFLFFKFFCSYSFRFSDYSLFLKWVQVSTFQFINTVFLSHQVSALWLSQTVFVFCLLNLPITFSHTIIHFSYFSSVQMYVVLNHFFDSFFG